MSRRGVRIACLLSAFILLSTGAAAQTGSIAGSVVDETGGVLPGVTVDAASPALIEGSRTTFSDGSGLYAIDGLRPGTYTITFTLPGFNTFIREGIELTTGFTANVDVTMAVGAVEETVTVSGASPVIDVQNVVHQENISRETLDAIPTGKTYWGYAALTVGATTDILGGGQDVGGSVGDTWGHVLVHGSSNTDGDILWDGMSVNASVTAGGGTGKIFFMNQAAIQEVVMSTGGMDAETSTGGVGMNAIPREGANAFSYYVNISGTNEHLQNLNWSDDLGARGMRQEQIHGIKDIWDFGAGIGGPIVNDRLWFYTAHRWWGTERFAPRSFNNLAPRVPSTGFAVDYQPDYDDPTVIESRQRDNSLRLTWQATERNKITLTRHQQVSCFCQQWAVFGLVDYNAAADYFQDPVSLTQAKWTMPASNRLLFEAGVSYVFNTSTPSPQPEVLPGDIGVFLVDPLIFLNVQTFSPSTPALYGYGHNFPNLTSHGSVSYVTGSHTFKAGVEHSHFWEEHEFATIYNNLQYGFVTPGVSFRVRQYGTPRNSFMRANDLGFYAQDQWTIDRLTLNLGVRYDSINGYVPAQSHPASRFVDSFSTGRIDNVPNWKDINPRLGAAYDLFGDGRTALKANLGRYVFAVGTSIAQIHNPMEAIQIFSDRTWNDNTYEAFGLPPGNGDFNPDCNLDNFDANGECGAIINPEFGTPIITSRFDDGVLEGWNKRKNNWQFSVGIQHEITEGWSVDIGYFRRANGNFVVLDNLNVGPEDFDEYSITAPVDPNLGPVSGEVLDGLYTITPEAQARGTNNVFYFADRYGDMSETFNGIDVAFNGRLENGITLTGGMATGAMASDECFVVDSPQQMRPGYCNVSPGWWRYGTQFKLNGSVPLPYETEFAFVFQNLPGLQRRSVYNAGADPAERAAIEAQLGRPMAVPSEEIALFPSGVGFYEDQPSSSLPYNGFTFLENSTQFEPRLTQLDLRFTKIVNVGGARVRAWFDIYNIFNSNDATNIVDNYVSGGLYPAISDIMNGRLFRFGGQFDW